LQQPSSCELPHNISAGIQITLSYGGKP
jgi:hypothetical protein